MCVWQIESIFTIKLVEGDITTGLVCDLQLNDSQTWESGTEYRDGGALTQVLRTHMLAYVLEKLSEVVRDEAKKEYEEAHSALRGGGTAAVAQVLAASKDE